MKNQIIKIFYLLVLIIWFLFNSIIFNSIIFNSYYEHFLDKDIHKGDCNYWKNNYEYKTDTIKKRWIIIKTIQDCNLKNHNKFLFENLKINQRVPGNLSQTDLEIAPSISGQAEKALNKIYNTKKTTDEWIKILNENYKI